MRTYGMTKVVLTSVVLAAAAAVTHSTAQGQAVTRSADDPRLEWGPCPAFMPTGCGLAVVHGDPAKPNADVFLRVPPNTDIPEHRHTSAERMILVAGELVVRYQGQPEAVLSPGMYAYGPATVSHSASCRGTTPCVLFIAFESAVDAVPATTPAP